MAKAPLKSEEACGPARPNPFGVLNSEARDGSCQVCEHEPESIPRCPKGKPAIALTHENLKQHEGKVVSFRGEFGYASKMCTLRGGPCHCSNTCGALLQLFASGTLRRAAAEEDAERIQRSDPAPSIHVGLASLSEEAVRERRSDEWPYVDRGGSLHCGGDEGSLCCPYAFDCSEQWADVIMTGVLSLEPEYPEEGTPGVYRLRMTSVCRE